MTTPPPDNAIAAFDLDASSIDRLTGGHINVSYAAWTQGGEAVVLQRVSPIFPPEVNEDIEAVTRHLAGLGIVTPVLKRTRDGLLHFESEGAVWRCLTRVPGETRERIAGDDEAREAGRILGVFHSALASFETPLRNRRPGVHDLERHLANLRVAIEHHAGHRAAAPVTAVAAEIGAAASALDPLPATRPRLVHGDPKISNIVFDAGRAVCLIDLDTIAEMPVAFELGDALRSWCNLADEDSPAARFSGERYRAALAGYEAGAPGLLTPAERDAIPRATVAIALELAARFAADALNESYFGWDRTRFDSASEHNLARARAQLQLAASARAAFGRV